MGWVIQGMLFILQLLIATILALAAVSKLSSRPDAYDSSLPAIARWRYFAFVLAAVELAVAGGLIWGPVSIAAAGATILFASFAITLIVYPKSKCQCFGSLIVERGSTRSRIVTRLGLAVGAATLFVGAIEPGVMPAQTWLSAAATVLILGASSGVIALGRARYDPDPSPSWRPEGRPAKDPSRRAFIRSATVASLSLPLLSAAPLARASSHSSTDRSAGPINCIERFDNCPSCCSGTYFWSGDWVGWLICYFGCHDCVLICLVYGGCQGDCF